MNWINSLYAKLATGLVLTLLAVGIVHTLSVTVLTQQLRETADQKLNRDLAKNLVADQRIVKGGQIDIEAMKSTFMMYMSINPSIEIYYLDAAGKILSFSAEPGKVKRDGVSLAPIKKYLSGTETFPLLGDDPRSHDKQKAFSVTPIPDAQNPEGYLYVVLHGEEFTKYEQTQSMLQILSLAWPGLVTSLVFGLLIGLFIFKRLTLRLRSLQEKVTTFAESDYRNANLFSISQSNNGDELTELENRFHQMSEHISGQWAALVQQDKLRREMIASISHDLRTPLASAQGYLETIALKSNQLSAADREQYLNIALKQTNRLQSLIDQLFELVKLEARDTEIVFESFSILELVYDVRAKFALEAQDRHVELSIETGAVDAQVVADAGLIERVLDNLIGNALQYTDAGRKIWIDVTTDNKHQICVSVVDEGKGITNEQKPLIFDRFHRADSPQRSSNGHAGLGLAIVKKIIELHNQKIWVESEVGRGSRFSFTLAPPQ